MYADDNHTESGRFSNDTRLIPKYLTGEGAKIYFHAVIFEHITQPTHRGVYLNESQWVELT